VSSAITNLTLTYRTFLF